MISVTHLVPRDDLYLGIIRAERVITGVYPADFEERLLTVMQERANGLTDLEDTRRRAARDVLRNGQYKPTGRGKPASEYLLRVAEGDQASFPRINAPVDVSNYFSLRQILPISLWDLDLAGAHAFVFRLGRPGETYAFNEAAQEIDLEDLVVGCRVRDHGKETPIVNPVKDSLFTKTTDSTNRVAACIYAPEAAVSPSDLAKMCSELASLLGACGRDVETASHVLARGESSEI